MTRKGQQGFWTERFRSSLQRQIQGSERLNNLLWGSGCTRCSNSSFIGASKSTIESSRSGWKACHANAVEFVGRIRILHPADVLSNVRNPNNFRLSNASRD